MPHPDMAQPASRRSHALLLAGFLVLALLFLLFGRLAAEISEDSAGAFDRHIITALRDPADPLRPRGPEWLAIAMIDLTSLGSNAVAGLLAMLAAGYLLVIRKGATAALLAGAVGGGMLASHLVKLGFVRPRPDLVPHLVDVHTTSFPSGHAANAAIVYLTLGAILSGSVPNRSARLYFMATAMLLVFIVGCSRVYLGVHWPSDVLGGWIIGSAWALMWWMIAALLQRRRRTDPAATISGACRSADKE